MSAKHISYKDLTPAQRQKGAAEARQRLQGMLANPFIPPDQKALLDAHMEKIHLWEQGKLPEEPVRSAPKALPPEPAPEPVKHSVEITEKLSVTAGVGGDVEK